MNDRLVEMTICDGEVGVTLGDNFHYFYIPCDLTIVFVTAAPSANDADLTLDINDDGAVVIEAISCAVAATPGTWKSKHMGGTNDPVRIAAGSKVSLDLNGSAEDTRILVHIWALTGEYFA